MLEIINLTEEETEQILSNEDDFDGQWYTSEAILTDRGYFTQEPGFTWMIGEEFPVFDEAHQEEPLTVL